MAAMPPQDAIIMDNFFCSPTTVDVRRGHEHFVTGFSGWVESLLPYSAGATQELWAASGSGIFDATIAGAVGAAVVTGLSNARFQTLQFGTSGGQFMLNVNGQDKLQGYDGTNWYVDGDGSHDITGVNTADCIHINSFKNRVYLVEENTFSVWYLPLQSISGAATEFDLSSLFKLGGSLMAMATWTIDNTGGIQEYAVFMSTEGEVALYQGTDPSSSATWSLVGMFHLGRPVGRRCFAKIGSDIAVISEDGLFPLSKALLTDRYQLQDALTNKIVNLVNDSVQRYGDNFGWQPILYPLGNKLLLNVPVSQNRTQIQYVQNTITGAWHRFTGWNAACFAVLQEDLYFGGATYVAKADTGYSDNDANIEAEVKTAFQYFGSPGQLKRFVMARPIFDTAANITPSIGMDVDFRNNAPTATASFNGTLGTAWDTALWDTFFWQSESVIQSNWQTVTGVGYCGAFHMRLAVQLVPLSWMSIDYVMEKGQIL